MITSTTRIKGGDNENHEVNQCDVVGENIKIKCCIDAPSRKNKNKNVKFDFYSIF